MKTEIVGLAAWIVLAAPFVLLLLSTLLFARRNVERAPAEPAATAEATQVARAPAAPHISPPAQLPQTAPAAPVLAGDRDSSDAGRWPSMTAARPSPAASRAPESSRAAPATPRNHPGSPAPSAPPQTASPAIVTQATVREQQEHTAALDHPAAPEPPPPLPPPRTDFAPLIASAEANDDVDRLPTLYIALARQQREDGLPDRQVGDLLRKAIRMAAMHGQKLAHAIGRIELGDLEAGAGDLTSACEHWQIARSLFHELRQARDIGSTDARMRRHGCPTDWVLNDF